MPKKSQRKSPRPPLDDSTSYLASWAGRLADAMTPAELAHLATDYSRLARTASLAADRQAARHRASAIRKIM